MTGFGKATAEIGGRKVTVEVKSLNSKQLDLMTKVAPLYREREMELRAMAQRALERGKVELTITVDDAAAIDAPHINAEVVQSYMRQVEALRTSLGLPPMGHDATSAALLMQQLLRLPDVIQVQQAVPPTPAELDAVVALATEAVDRLMAFRLQEGASLARVFGEKLDAIAALLAEVEPYEHERIERVRHNLEARLEQLSTAYDPARLEQELIYYIEKLDINEEKHRLDNHLRYFRETMEAPHTSGGAGKKLGFIAQEMGREINTLGSKSNHAEMQRLVVRMKDELEQIKEQVLNVL